MQDFNIQAYLNINVATLIAGLLGALITMLRKSSGSLQARIIGFFTAVATVLYLVPFLIFFLNWKFGIVLHSPAENLLAFVCGLLSQTITENFADDPTGSLYKWAAGFKRMKRVLWDGEAGEPPKIIQSEDGKK